MNLRICQIYGYLSYIRKYENLSSLSGNELSLNIVLYSPSSGLFVIGNVLGSNIMNIAAVLGVTLLLSPIPVQFINIKVHLFYMISLTLLLIFLVKFKGAISKYYAIVLMIIYISFIYINFQ